MIFNLVVGMERSQTFAVWITTTTLLSMGSIAWAAPADPEQERACINTVVFELNGVPRADVRITADSPADSGFVNWQTRDGRSGFCQIGAEGTVDQFGIEQAEITQPRPTAAYTIPERVGVLVTVATNGGDINVRQSPGGEIVRTAAAGETFSLTGQSSGEWVELESGGWVSRFLVQPIDQNPTLGSTSIHTNARDHAGTGGNALSNQAIVATDGAGLYVRQAANGEVIDSLADGSVVTLTGQRDGEWVEIEGGGWVSEAYLQY